MKIKVVNNSVDEQANHRSNFTTCPHCYHEMKSEVWEKAVTIIALEPRCYKSGCVAMISECPECFKPSWVHWQMDHFDKWSSWPKHVQEAVSKKGEAVKLSALRTWGRCICHSCKHLTSGKVQFTAWRECKRGFGPAVEVKEGCETYEKV